VTSRVTFAGGKNSDYCFKWKRGNLLYKLVSSTNLGHFHLWRPLSAHLPKEQETDLTDEPRHLTTKKGNVARRRYEGTPVETLSKGIKDVAPLNSLSRRPTSTATASTTFR
jgi:hypothetical protein